MVSTVVTGLPVDCPGGQAIAPRPPAAAGGGAVIFGMVIVETQPAVDLNPLGQRQRIKGINPEGIGLAVGVRPVSVQPANRQVAPPDGRDSPPARSRR